MATAIILNKDSGTKHLFPICLLVIFLFYHASNVVLALIDIQLVDS